MTAATASTRSLATAMTKDEVHISGLLLVALGAVCVWAGTRLFRRPAETAEDVVRFMRRGRGSATASIRPDPTAMQPVIRLEGGVLLALGVSMGIIGAYLWWLSRP